MTYIDDDLPAFHIVVVGDREEMAKTVTCGQICAIVHF